MSSAEFVEWGAFEKLEGPLGGSGGREDWRMGMIASTIANASRNPKRRSKPYQPSDFIPDWPGSAGVAPEPLSPEAVADKVKGAFVRMAARGRRRSGQ